MPPYEPAPAQAPPRHRRPDPPSLRLRPWRLVSFVASLGLTATAFVVLVASALAGPTSVGPAADGSDTLASPVVDGETGSIWLPGPVPPTRGDTAGESLAPEPPARSGAGRRVVFDQSAQQVWLVRDGESVRSTYLVSGSVHDNLQPGRYAVSSRSRHAVGFDYRSTMEYMVRFAEGATAAIGFHDIPIDDEGAPLQQVARLGTPTSSGCIRQREHDARELWRFAPVGTRVVVVA